MTIYVVAILVENVPVIITFYFPLMLFNFLSVRVDVTLKKWQRFILTQVLLRSPEVMQFLQKHQASLLAAQQQTLVEAQQHELSLGEVEEDAVS
jgi:hypothetical protein